MLTPEQVKKYQAQYGLTKTSSGVQTLDQRLAGIDSAVASTKPIDTSELPRSRTTGEYGASGAKREYLDTKTGKYVPDSQATFGQRASALAEQFIDPAFRAVGSAVKFPVDIVRSLMGKDPSTEIQGRTLPSGKRAETFQSEFATKTLPAVQAGTMSPLAATADVVGQTVGGVTDASIIGGLASKVGTKASGLIANKAEQSASKLFNESLKITAPKITPKLEEAALQQGRIREGSLLRKTQILPTEQDKMVAESVQDIVSKSAKPQENINSINQIVSRINSDVKGFVRDNKVPFNEAQLRTKLGVVKNENKLIFASDPNVEKVVDAAINEFVTHVKSFDTSGVFEARQSFDKLPAVKRLLQSERVGENVKREVVLGIRRAANEYVSDLLPANNPFKALLRQETNMLRAVENIAEKSTGRVGKKSIGIFLDKHPLIKKALPWLVGTTGAGIVVTN